MGLGQNLKGLFISAKPLKPQMVHYRGTGPLDGVRMHLRIEPEGKGVLVINASKVIHLNQTAAEYAKLILEAMPEEDAIQMVRGRYHVSRAQAEKDYRDVRVKIETLGQTDEICPVTYLGFTRVDPFSVPSSAPHRMDLALTYLCNNKCSHCYLERQSDTKPIDLGLWKATLDKLWEIGIPHVCFTGGEATLSPHLLKLISHAEEVGIVTGLLTNGRKLANSDYTVELVSAGLDHVQITLESHDEAIHDEMSCAPGAWKETVAGIQNAVYQSIYLVTNSTLSKRNAPVFDKTLEFLKDLGVSNFACNGFIHSGEAVGHPDAIAETDLPEILEKIRDKANELDMRFIWYTPTQYCNCNPVELELGLKHCTAGISNMCIEPDGSVLPCQSYFDSLGNILTDKWEKIWNHPNLVALRERKWIDPKCGGCDLLELCGGGCPLYLKNGKATCTDTLSNAR